MTIFIVGLMLGILIGFAAALVLNHKKPAQFDDLTDKADKAREKL